MYTIRQASLRSGVSVPLLRAWERRYGVVEPARTAAGYRLYDDEAVARLRAMRRLVDAGWSPSNAAAAVLDGSVPPASGDQREPPRVPGEAAPHVERFVAAAAALDAAELERVLDQMFASGSFEQVAEASLLPALQALGDAWAAGRVGVAGEHAASQAVQRRLAAAFQAAALPRSERPPVLVGLPPGARHELGALAFSIVARRAGLPILYLGADLPASDWVATARVMRPSAAVIGSVGSEDRGPAGDVAGALWGEQPDLLVAFGGRNAPTPGVDLDVGGGRRAVRLPDGLVAAVATLGEALGGRPVSGG